MKLALEANLAQQTIVKSGTANSRPSVLSVSTIKRTLKRAGVEFPEGEPVRLGGAVHDKNGPVRETRRGRPGWRCTMTSRAAPCELQGRPSYATRRVRPR